MRLRHLIPEMIDNTEVHNNISINKLKGITKQSTHGISRFVIDTEGKLHGADAAHWLHHDIQYTPSDIEKGHDNYFENNKIHIRGFMKHHGNDKFSYSGSKFEHVGRTNNEPDHPLLQKMRDTYKVKPVHDKIMRSELPKEIEN